MVIEKTKTRMVRSTSRQESERTALPPQKKTAVESRSVLQSDSVLFEPSHSQALLNLVVQAGRLPKNKRKQWFLKMVEEMFENPLHPCAKLKRELKQAMIDDIAEVLTEAPIKTL